MAKTKKRRGKTKPKIIANMGLFWHRDKVLWSGNKKVGRKRLLGVRAGAKKSGEVDFWYQGGVYALYADYRLVYVGQAGLGGKSCIGSRLKSHTKDDLADRWDMFSWFGRCKVKKSLTLGAEFERAKTPWSDVADVLEGILIEVAEPPQNNQKGRFGPGVHRYIQVPYEPLEDDTELTIKKIAKDLERIKEQLEKKK